MLQLYEYILMKFEIYTDPCIFICLALISNVCFKLDFFWDVLCKIIHRNLKKTFFL